MSSRPYMAEILTILRKHQTITQSSIFYQVFSACISLQNIPFYSVDIPITTGPYLRELEMVRNSAEFSISNMQT